MKIVFTPSKRDVNVKGIYCPECGERIRNVGLPEGCRIENLGVRCKRCRKYHNVSVEPDEIRNSKRETS